MSELTPQPIDADDPGLTAYALGELEGAEAARYRSAVAASAELQAIVAEIQAEACLLTNELAREPQIPITAERRHEIATQAGKSGAVAVTQKRAFRISRRVVGVAASVALIPGAWYAFQAAFPRSPRAPVLAQQEPQAKPTAYYLNDDVQYFPETAKVSAALEKYKGRKALSQSGDARAMEKNLGWDDLDSPPAAASMGPLQPVITGPLPDKLGVTYDAAPQTRISFGVGIGNPPQSQPATGVPNLLPPSAQPKGKEDLSRGSGGSNTSGANNINSQFGDFMPPFGGGRKYAKSSASEPKDVPHSVETRSGLVSPEAYQWYAENRQKSVPVLNKVPYVSRAHGNKASQSDAASDKLNLAWRKPRLPWDDAPPADPNAPSGSPSNNRSPLLAGDGKSRDIARAPEKAKPDTFAIINDPYLGVPENFLELEAKSKSVERNFRIDPTRDEVYKPIYENAFITPQEQQLSTFSIDVDTASYANLRRFVQGGQLPSPDAVRIEELVNYFSYQYPQPQDGRPFSVQTDIAACPWQPGHQLVRIGLKGKEIPKEQRSPTNLVFLVDVSGSMQAENKLPLVRESLKTLVNQLDERDKVAIVTYAGEAGVRLPSTSVAQKEVVLNAIAGLGAGGSTNGAAGINTAYDIAAQEFLEKGTNRVILCTDGDFNVGVTSDDALVKLIQTRAKGGVFLSVFGFGMGNLKDAKLEQLADKGNGQYGYIDDQQEANKVFVQELMGTLVTIAKDVKIQIDFNKDTVASYRLVGYENRVMAAEDFHDDKKDAGEIGAGHTVTALYQIVPTKDLKANEETRWLTVKLRYKQPDAATSVLMESPLVGQPGQLKLASSDFQFAASVAACGMLLRHSQHAGQANWGLVKELAQSGLSYDPHGHRRAFIGLAAQAESLMGQFYPTPVPATDSTVGGKYKSLLRRLHAPTDAEKYGQFNDFGHSDRKAYAGAENLPEGYWVYAAPYWYIWAETTDKPKGPAN